MTYSEVPRSGRITEAQFERFIQSAEQSPKKTRLDIRTHHIIQQYVPLMAKLARSRLPFTEVAALTTIQTATANIRASTNIHDLNEGFLSSYGHNLTLTDQPAPKDYAEDTLSQNLTDLSGTFPTNMIQAFYDFLTYPSNTPTILGPEIIDKICQGCDFGKGQGGLHCRTTSAEAEMTAGMDILFYTTQLLNDPRIEVKKQEDPPRYEFQRKIVQVQNLPPNSTERPWALKFTMSLGLLRDSLTYYVTNGQFIQYEELLDATRRSLETTK